MSWTYLSNNGELKEKRTFDGKLFGKFINDTCAKYNLDLISY